MINKKNISALLLSIVFITSAFAQEKPAKEKKKEAKPVKNTFGTLVQINSQTVEVIGKKALQFEIQHRFGQITQQKDKDLYGLFGAANVRIGLNYGITKNLMIGIGGTKANHLYNGQLKYKILTQTKSNSMPVTLTYFGDIIVNTTVDPMFKSQASKLAYFNQLMLAKKIGKKLSLQIDYGFTHYNLIDTTSTSDIRHETFRFGFLGRYNFSAQSSVIIEYHQPYTILDGVITELNKPNLGIGIEIATSGHAFQIFITTAGDINQEGVPGYTNFNDLTKDDLRLGFNIARKWRF